MEKYYYCAAKTYFKTEQVLKSILEIFDEVNQEEFDFTEIYVALRDKLFVTSVNKKNLQSLIGAVEVVKRNDVQQLYNESITLFRDNDVIESAIFFEKDYVITKKNTVPKEVVCQYIVEIFDEQNLDKLTFVQIQEHLAKKLNTNRVNMTNLKALLKSTKPYATRQEVETIQKYFNDQMQLQREEMEIKKEQNIRSIIDHMHIDNRDVPIDSIAMPSLARELHSMGVNKAGDLINLTSNDIGTLIGGNKERYFAEMLKMLPESYCVRVDNDFYKYVICGVNRSSGKKSKQYLKYIDVMDKRAKGSTLQVAGDKYELTRERTRQIESKFINRFDSFANYFPGGIVNILKACAGGKDYISKADVNTIIHQCVDIFWYLLKEHSADSIVYIEELNIFAFVGELNWYDELVGAITNLPTIINENVLQNKIDELYATFVDLGIKVEKGKIEKLVKSSYKKNGYVYSKSRMTKPEMYFQVMQKYFADGIRLYDDDQIDKLRLYCQRMFATDDIPSKNRAIRARIQATAMAIDRGKYVVPNNNQLISYELLADICEHIDNNKKDIFMINTLFYLFADRLRDEGITNRYMLQYVLRKKVGNRYHLSRDYISKDKNTTSVYNAIVSYIRDMDCVVTKQDLQNEFPGVPSNVFAFALADENIVVGLGTYAHKNYIEKFKVSLQFIAREMNKIVGDGEIHNCQELFDILKKELPAIIEEINITDRYFLFSMMEEFWADKFEFRRPFFAKIGVNISKQYERIWDFVNSNTETDIAELRGFINENSFIVNSTLDLVDSLSDVVIYKNKETLTKVDSVIFNSALQEKMDDFLDKFIGTNKLPVQVDDFNNLPDIGLVWNEWLLYSIVNKYSKQFKAVTTNSKYAMAEPRFARR